MNRPLLCVALLLGVSGSCLAQNSVPATKIEPPAKAEETKKIEGDGVALYDAARDAAKKVKDPSCKITSSYDGQKPVEGEIVVVFKDGAAGLPIGNYSLKGAMGDKKLAAVFDGKVLRTIDHVEKQLVEMPAQNGVAFPRDESGMLVPNWYLEARMPEQPGVSVRSIVKGERQAVDGVDCDTVVRTRVMEQGDTKYILAETLVLGVADHLPRRVEMIVTQEGGEEPGEKMRSVTTFRDVKIDSAPADSVFALAAPEGYKTKTMTAEDLANAEPKLAARAGDAAKDFALKDADGKVWKLADFKGRVLLMDFWATWCGPCKAAMPKIQALHEKYKDKKVTIAGVNTWERGKDEKAVKYMQDQKYTYTCLLGGDDLASSYNVPGIPTLILVDGEGKILFTTVGVSDEAEKQIEELIEKELAKGK
ncbi:MAG: TlpA family protein disulfide reductase [Phycisphaerales bacterium]|jgi:thiol-disulfide isomerase/thioredoxin|nr:TlpA family protein disulfide reductase [Phycisphaerales bacterium]